MRGSRLKNAFTKTGLVEDERAAMIDSIPTLAWCCLPDGTTEFLNHPWLDYTGLSLENALGWGWTAAIHPDDLGKLMATWQELRASGKPGVEEARLRRFDGEYRWFLFRTAPDRDDTGAIVRWYGTNTDIEDLHRARYLITAEKKTLEMIAGGASLRATLETLCDTIDAQSPKMISSILLMDPDGRHIRPAAGRRLPQSWADAISPVAIGPCVGSCGTAAFLRKVVIVSDIASDPLWIDFREVALANGLRAAWSQPLITRNGDVAGTFCIYYSEPTAPEPCDLQLIESAGHIALIAIEAERAEEKLRQDEREFRRMTDAISTFIHVLRPDGSYLYANRTVLDYLGFTLEDVQREDYRARAFHPEDVERLREERRQALARGMPFENEQRARGKDGKYRWFLVRYNPLRDEQGKVLRWYATGTDIDERKQAEERIRNENLALREEIDRSSMSEQIVGSSDILRHALSQVSKVAPTESTVFISGETGTGKELIARAIHRASKRSSRAFVRVNCAAIPPSLIASELFGHEKGAFTGAIQRRVGRFEAADGGTIFLDEIGDLPPETQIALLRVLQEKEIERVGSNRPIPVDVRVITATNRDLKAAVASGTFRQDLFFRLNVFPIHMPSLRERKDDIPLLVGYLVDRYAKKAGKKIKTIQKQTLDLFQRYDWPGNVRELQNVIERAVILCEQDPFVVDETWLRPEPPKRANLVVSPFSTVVEKEREIIESALKETRGRISGPNGAAEILRIPRQTLESKIRTLGIDKFRFKAV